MISAEAPVLFAKAAEIFIEELTLRSWIHTEENKRKTLQVCTFSMIERSMKEVANFAEKRHQHGDFALRTVRLSHRYRSSG